MNTRAAAVTLYVLAGLGAVLVLGLQVALIDQARGSALASARTADAHERVAATEEEETSVLRASKIASEWASDKPAARHTIETPVFAATALEDLRAHRALFLQAESVFPPKE